MNALRVMFRVIWALVLREASTRNGKMRLGYIWVFLEPAIYIAGFALFRSVLGARVPFGENALVYLITALLTFRAAIGLTRRTLGAIGANLALLTFPQVKTFDVIVARILLEAGTWIALTFLFVFGLYFFMGVWAVQVPERFIAGFAATLLFGGSFGFFNAAFVRIFPFWERLLALLSLPLLVGSAVFFLPSALPPEILAWLWWNPYLHLVEWVRSGVYLDYTPFLTPSYVIFLSGIFLFAGLFLNRFYQNRMIQS